MSGIHAVVRHDVERGVCVRFHYKCDDHYGIYNKMMEITDNDHEISCDAASWCELASVGEIYEFREGAIRIEKNLWHATEEQLKAGDVLKEKIFEYIEENKKSLDERRTRQILKSMFVTWVYLVDTDVDKSDSDRLLYDMYYKICEYTKCDFDRFEKLLVGLLL